MSAVPGTRHRTLLGGVPPALVVMYVFIPVVSQKLFSSFNCVRYEYDGASGASKSFLRDSAEVRCHETAEHENITAVALLLMFICVSSTKP